MKVGQTCSTRFTAATGLARKVGLVCPAMMTTILGSASACNASVFFSDLSIFDDSDDDEEEFLQ